MREFKRNKETGILEVWDGSRKVGEVLTMGDEVKKEGDDGSGVSNGRRSHRRRKKGAKGRHH